MSKVTTEEKLESIFRSIPRTMPYEVWRAMHLKNTDSVVEPISASARPAPEHPANVQIAENNAKKREPSAWAKMSQVERQAYLAAKKTEGAQ